VVWVWDRSGAMEDDESVRYFGMFALSRSQGVCFDLVVLGACCTAFGR
jgi:hypothetical protein